MDNIEKILQELYALDPAFKAHETKLRTLIGELLASRPEVRLDREFVESLRRKLMAQASLMQEQNYTPLRPAAMGSPENKHSTLKGFNFMKKLNFALGALALVAVVAATGLYMNRTGKIAFKDNQPESMQLLASEMTVTQVGKEAFGKLSLGQMGSGATGKGGGGAGGRESAAAPLAADSYTSSNTAAAPSSPDISAKIAPAMVNFKYVYKGEDIKVEQEEAEVFRRVKGIGSASTASQLVSRLNLGVVDINSFASPSLQNITLNEDREFGLSISVDLKEGTVGIYENWSKWPHPESQCRDEACYRNSQLKVSDIPDDATVIGIANQFLADHNISAEGLGEPVVQNSWRESYEKFQDKSNFYIPDVLTVIYPLQVNGQTVYDEGGNPAGFGVNVNVRHKKPSGVYELNSKRYESSMYKTETDAAKIRQIAEKGGFRNYLYKEPGAREMEVELGTPKYSYIKFWKYNQEDGQSQELLIPALIFPVTKAPNSEYFYQKNVVVPLVREILDEQGSDGGPTRIMPAAEPKQ